MNTFQRAAQALGEIAADLRCSGIQISGLEDFDPSRWREAILYYLFGVWGNKQEVMYRPKIMFGNITLRLDTGSSSYYAYGSSTSETAPHVPPEAHLIVGCGQGEVEQALIRFVKNDAIKVLTIAVPNHGRFCLWKKAARGEYGYSGDRLPTMMELVARM